MMPFEDKKTIHKMGDVDNTLKRIYTRMQKEFMQLRQQYSKQTDFE